MNTFILLAVFATIASMAVAAPAGDTQAAAHLRNRRSQYSNLLNSILELAERQEADVDSDTLLDALAGAEEYGLLDNEELADLQDYVDKQGMLTNLLGGLMGWEDYHYIKCS